MAYEVREGEGSLFLNDKRTHPKAPHFTGKGLYKGERLKLSAWKKQSKSGKNYISLSIEEFEKKSTNPVRPIVETDDDPFAL